MRICTPEKKLPLNIGVLHFIGIGGIGMSGIAEILHNLGYHVQGSDAKENPNTQRLEELGIAISIGQSPENVRNAAVVIKSSAVMEDNPEIIAARAQSIPVVKRAEMLAELMRLKASVAVAGTHGKTTTTSFVAALFEAAALHPTVINGGVINARGTNAYLGSGDWLIAEADESDGTFIKVPATIGVITNIDPEHLEYYGGSFDELRAAFKQFIEQLPFYGFAVLCIDHPEVLQLSQQITDRRIITYSLENPHADISASNIRSDATGSYFDVTLSTAITEGNTEYKDFYVAMPGKHNASNALAALAVAFTLGFDTKALYQGLAEFKGVKRRFTPTGKVADITIIDDYAHHPIEISATLHTARQIADTQQGKVIAVIQPHRFSRLSELWDGFIESARTADHVIIMDVFSAGEAPIKTIDSHHLAHAMQQQGIHAQSLETIESLPAIIADIATPNDMVICMGAGSITKTAYDLPSLLTPLVMEHSS